MKGDGKDERVRVRLYGNHPKGKKSKYPVAPSVGEGGKAAMKGGKKLIWEAWGR